jgi:hypothetical protein
MHGSTIDRHTQLLQELAAERAEALSRISRTLERLIEQLRLSAGRLPTLEASDRATELANYRQLRREAMKYRWYLDVQRESIGLRYHESLDRYYAVPGPI